MTRPFTSLRLMAASMIVALAATSAPAQTPAEIVDLRLKGREAQGKADVARWERDERGGTPDRNFDPPPALKRVLGQVYQSIHAMPQGPAPNAEPDAALVAAWRAAQTRQLEFRKAVAEREAEYGFSWSERTPPRFQPTLLDGAFLLFAIVAFVVSCLLALHERRRQARQKRRSRLPGGIGIALAPLLLALAGCGGPGGARTDTDRRVLEAEKRAAEDELAAAAADLHDLSQAREGQTQLRIENWAKYVDPPALKPTVVERETELLNRIRVAAERAAIEDRLGKDIADAAALESEEASLDAMARSAAWWQFGFAGVRVGAAALLALVAFAPFALARRRAAAEIKLSSRTCPQCLAVGKLAVQKTPRGSGEYTESTYLECKAKDRDGVECGYRVARSHQYVPRLCFPTVGIRGGGKTHMLTTAYAAIHNRVAPTGAAVQPAPSVMDEQFRQYIELILRHRGEAGGTIHDTAQVPPLLIHARDVDRWGPDGVLVNLFDYSGELIEETPLAAALRERAMRMNGFMMIFDPTQIYGDVGGVTLEDLSSATRHLPQASSTWYLSALYHSFLGDQELVRRDLYRVIEMEGDLVPARDEYRNDARKRRYALAEKVHATERATVEAMEPWLRRAMRDGRRQIQLEKDADVVLPK